MTKRRIPFLTVLIPTIAALVLSTSACTAAVPPTATPTGSAQTCVPDPAAVPGARATAASTTASLPAALTGKLDAAARASFAEVASPGAIVGVRTPEGTWTAAYGKADPVAGTPMTVGLHTRIGSVTKTFTGTLLMQLAEDRRVSLDDTIDRYIQGIQNGDRITLRQMISMTSGIPSYTKNPAFTDVYFARPETVFSPEELVKAALAEPPSFEPGEGYEYSNTNTVLIGLVIEKVTGQPFAKVLQDRILSPLGLRNTSWPGESSALPTPYARGYTLQGDAATPTSPSDATFWSPTFASAAGELISTMDDLLVWGRALGTGQGLLSSASQIERLSIPAPAGYGIALGCQGGWVGHTGELPGYNTTVFYDTTTDTTVVVQTNSDISNGNCDQSPLLADNRRDLSCSSPATRMFVALSTALGHTFEPNPQH